MDGEATFFKNAAEFREWLNENHDTEKVLWLGYYKKNSGKANYTWSETVDEALCFGWIDGLRRSINEEKYKIRFTPRKITSIWSAVNLKKIKELTQAGLMQPAGIEIFEKRKESNSNLYSFEQKEKPKLEEKYEAQFKNNPEAWNFFEQLAPSTRKLSIWWVMSAKREATRQKRIETLIECSDAGEKLPAFRWSDKKKK